jgi:GNAT superfamily N-acetyltransferase
VEIRLLRKDEFYLVKEIYESQEDTVNNDNDILGAFDSDGTFMGMLASNLIPHVGPIFVKPRYRRKGVARALYKFMGDTPYFTFPSNKQAVALMRSLGLKERKDLRVFEKEI